MPDADRRAEDDRRRVPRGGRRADDRGRAYPAVVVADAYDAAREPIARYLERFHFDVHQAADGEELLGQIIACTPHLVIADSNLPGMPARRLRRWLDQSWRTRRLPIILMLSESAVAERTAAAAPVLVKPFSLSAMLDEVRCAMRTQNRTSA